MKPFFDGGLKKVVDFLVSFEKHKTAWEIIELAYKKAKTIADFDEIGAAALRAQHNEIRLNCCLSILTMVKNTEDLFSTRENLYKTYNALNQPEKALFYIEQNLLLKPNDPDTLMQKAFNLSLLNDKVAAEKIIINVAATTPEIAENIEFSLSGKLLREGKTASGIRGFITTFKKKNDMFHLQMKMKHWNGGIYPGKKIYVLGEGGIGDELINIRFFDHLKRLGMQPILYNTWKNYRPDIAELFKRHGYEVINENFFIDRTGLWTEMMGLPAFLGLTEDKLWNGPYLKPLRQKKNCLDELYQLDKKQLKIGIKCEGNPWFEQDIYRKIPINELLNSLPSDAEVFYVDKEKSYDGTISLQKHIETWEDTLDFIDQMDVIVSSCTSLVHAAGAMGKKTIVIVPIAEYYVWTSTRTNNTTPWYGDNFTILRQTKVRSWKEPLNQVKYLL
jgi:tetratricopeptide (TPR) repeat protein